MASPNDTELRETVRGLIFDVLKGKRKTATIDDIKEGVALATDLSIDSLDVLQIMATVEKRYKIRIPEDELRRMTDLGAIVKIVRKYVPA